MSHFVTGMSKIMEGGNHSTPKNPGLFKIGFSYFIGIYSLPSHSLRHARHKNVTLHYISRTKRDKKLIFSMILNKHTRSKTLKSEISIFIIMGGVVGQIFPALKIKISASHSNYFDKFRIYMSWIFPPPTLKSQTCPYKTWGSIIPSPEVPKIYLFP